MNPRVCLSKGRGLPPGAGSFSLSPQTFMRADVRGCDTATCRSLWDHLGQGVRIKSTVNPSPYSRLSLSLSLSLCNFKPADCSIVSPFFVVRLVSSLSFFFFFLSFNSALCGDRREKIDDARRAKLRLKPAFQPSNRILIGIRARHAARRCLPYRCVHRAHSRIRPTYIVFALWGNGKFPTRGSPFFFFFFF